MEFQPTGSQKCLAGKSPHKKTLWYSKAIFDHQKFFLRDLRKKKRMMVEMSWRYVMVIFMAMFHGDAIRCRSNKVMFHCGKPNWLDPSINSWWYILILVGGLEPWNFITFPWNFEWLSQKILGMENHANWRTHSIIFQDGVGGSTTNQNC